jgi:hypothetical protein
VSHRRLYPLQGYSIYWISSIVVVQLWQPKGYWVQEYLIWHLGKMETLQQCFFSVSPPIRLQLMMSSVSSRNYFEFLARESTQRWLDVNWLPVEGLARESTQRHERWLDVNWLPVEGLAKEYHTLFKLWEDLSPIPPPTSLRNTAVMEIHTMFLVFYLVSDI